MEQPCDIAAEVRQGKVSGVGYVDGQRLLGASGPRDALNKMPCLGKEGMLVWTETARLNAILGGMSLSLKSFKSGLNCYTAFVGARLRWHVCACAGMPTAGRQVLPRGRLLPSEPDRVAGLVDALQVRRHEAGRHWCAWACGWVCALQVAPDLWELPELRKNRLHDRESQHDGTRCMRSRVLGWIGFETSGVPCPRAGESESVGQEKGQL